MKRFLSTLFVAAALMSTACQEKQEKVTVMDLEGAWQIVTVDDVATPDSLLHGTHISFDLTLERVTGRASCNLFNSQIEKDENEADKFSLSHIATTMMACPHLDFERRVLDALEASAQVARDGDDLVLLDENGNKRIGLKSLPTPPSDVE